MQETNQTASADTETKQNEQTNQTDTPTKKDADQLIKEDKVTEKESLDQPEFPQQPDESVLESLAEKLSNKWHYLGEELGLTKCQLNEISSHHKSEKESYLSMLNEWKHSENEDKPYTWDTFFTALRSSLVNEESLVDNIITNNIVDDIPEETSEKITLQEGVIYSKNLQANSKWSLPKFSLNDCKTITFFVVIDFDMWKVSSSDEVFLSVASREVNSGDTAYGFFKKIFQVGNYAIYSCHLPIPPDFQANHLFYYKYVVISKKISERYFQARYETLSVYNNADWRIVPTKDTQYRFDAAIVQKRTFPFGGNLVADAARSAITTYMKWAYHEQNLSLMLGDNDDANSVEAEIRRKVEYLCGMIQDLKCPLFLS
jgi:hypothetical protein